jgi:hypothetical protein
MKRILAVLLAVLFLSGCSTYKFQRGEQKPFDQGYVVYRDGYLIPEYSLGENSSLPEDINLAQERFKRRRKTVEYYYRKLGEIENGFERFFWNPCAMFIKTIFGQLKLPFVAISNYKYNHNPAYREQVIKKDEQQQAKERARINQIKDQLNTYVQKDLLTEGHKAPEEKTTPPAITIQTEPTQAKATPPEEKETMQEKTTTRIEALPEQATTTPESAVQAKPQPIPEIPPAPEPEKQLKIYPPKPATIATGLTAIIIAKPAKGYSPLRVQFYGSKSTTSDRKGRIVSYSWDFGDGDTSTKQNPVNTYYSGSYEPREFTAKLTVLDEAGNIATTSRVIRVLNK